MRSRGLSSTRFAGTTASRGTEDKTGRAPARTAPPLPPAVPSFRFSVDANRPRLRILALRQMQSQDTILILRPQAVAIHVRGYREAPRKLSIRPLDTMVGIAVVFELELSLALNCERLALEVHLHVFLLEFGKIELDEDFVVGLEDVDGWNPTCCRLLGAPKWKR